ncbi:ATP-binding cassette domain-containing protein [Larkinella bovis]|uniref:ATP-binding cassette domain-containing protein n=1 Tax=Larkinella bovis TaxID=683041 RepID=A0ABW0ICY4_9BACT
MNPPRSVLEADGIELHLSGRKILQSVYIKLETGQITGLLGRNGSGKSCLMKSVMGLMPTGSQSVRVDNKYIEKPYQKPGLIRYLPQQPFIPPSLTLQAAFDWYGVKTEEIARDYPTLYQRRNQKISTLSGGEKRLAGVLLILTSNVAFVLLDEPFLHLMPVQIEQVAATIRQESRRKGILLSDHRYETVLGLSDPVYYLNTGGRTIRLTTPEQNLRDLGYIY